MGVMNKTNNIQHKVKSSMGTCLFLWMTKIHSHEPPLGFTVLCTCSPFQNGFQTASDLSEGRKPMKPKQETVAKHFTQ